MKLSSDLFFTTHADRLFNQLDCSVSNSNQGFSSTASLGNEISQGDWSCWEKIPCVFLLGEPGSGKTSEFDHQFSLLTELGHTVFMSRWQDWCEGDDIFATLIDHESFFAKLDAGQTVWWFIDALDEGRIKTEYAFDVIKKGLREIIGRGSFENLKLRISCRSRDSRPTEANQLESFFPSTTSGDEVSNGVVTLQLLPLDEVAIRTLAQEKLCTTDAVQQFLTSLEQRHVVPLAGQPLLLAMMLNLFQQGDEALSHDRTGLYEQAVEHLIKEQNPIRGDQAPPQTMPIERLNIAKSLAVHMIFGGKDAISVPDQDKENERTLDAAICTPVKREAVLETLNTGLFTRHAKNGFAFIHRSFAEFLAAWTLSEQLKDGLSLVRLLPLFPIEQGVIPGPVRETASWLAGWSSNFRNWLISHDPVTAAQGDTVRYLRPESEKLIAALADRFGKREWQREFDRFGDLARSASDSILRQLLEPGNGSAVRRMVMEMIDAAGATQLFPDILEVVLDCNTEIDLRKKGAIILAKQATDELADELLPLLYLPADQDKDDEICGALLCHLYPKHLTVKQVLGALHAPRNRSFISFYRRFWDYDFLERKSLTCTERHLVLDSIVPLLNKGSSSSSTAILTENFTKLLLVELDEEDQDIEKLGLWLVKLASWVQHHGMAYEKEYQQLIEALRAMPQLRSALLLWQLKNWPQNKEYQLWWHFPFYDRTMTEDDAQVLIRICNEYSKTPEISESVFESLIGLACKSPSAVRVETLEGLAKSENHYNSCWQAARVCQLDSQAARMFRANQESKVERAERKTKSISIIQSNIESLRAGNANLILNMLIEVQFDMRGKLPLKEIGENYGVDVAQAVKEGVLNVWENLDGSLALWPYSTHIPDKAIVAGFGYQLQDVEHSSLSEYQVEYLVWRLLHRFNDSSAFLAEMWKHHESVVLPRLQNTLIKESSSSEESTPIVWAYLASLDEFPNGMMDEIVDFVLSEGVPIQTRARQCALKILIKSLRRVEVIRLITSLVDSEWSNLTSPTIWAENAAISVLSAWWLLEPDAAFDVLNNRVLQGTRRPHRTIAFVTQLQELLGNDSFFHCTWPETIPWEKYAAILPLLYPEPPCQEPLPDDEFSNARTSLVNHICEAPIELALSWFGLWKEDAAFGVHCDWFQHIYGGLIRRRADESWSALSVDTINHILEKTASLVRSESDFMLLLIEIMENELTPAFSSDHNLVPLLWDGTKSGGNRKHRDEKALQTAIYGQLMILINAMHIVGAREPEVWNAKKPDARLSFASESGLVVNVPVEIKWTDNSGLWDSIEDQLLNKYMRDPRVRYGFYIVGWAGPNGIKRGPNKEKPNTPAELKQQLQTIADQCLVGTDKQVIVCVLDASD